MSRTKKILSAFMAVLLTLSVSYFAFVSPTSAWLYQAVELQEGTFTFGDFDANQAYDEDPQGETYTYGQTYNIKFPAATRFADNDEILFDDVIHVAHVTANNIGEVSAYVGADVRYNDANLDGDTTNDNIGLRYCFLSLPNTITDYKAAIEAMLTTRNVTLRGYSSSFFQTATNIEETYASENISAINALNANNAAEVTIAGGTTSELYVIFWVEYGDLLAYYDGTTNGAFDKDSSDVRDILALSNYSVTVNFNATQEDYLETPTAPTLSISNVFADENTTAKTSVRVQFSASGLYHGDYTLIDASGVSHVMNTSNGRMSLKHNERILIDGCPIGETYAVYVSLTAGYVYSTIAGEANVVSPNGNSIAITQTPRVS